MVYLKFIIELNSVVLEIKKDLAALVIYFTQKPNQVIPGGNYQIRTNVLKELTLEIIWVPLILT